MALISEVAILGASPAAVATACELRRLGHEVLPVGIPRSSAVEGVSERAMALLRHQCLEAAVESVRGPAERTGTWAGSELPGSQEYIADRGELDNALLTDAVCSGATIRKERALGYERLGPASWRIRTAEGADYRRSLVTLEPDAALEIAPADCSAR